MSALAVFRKDRFLAQGFALAGVLVTFAATQAAPPAGTSAAPARWNVEDTGQPFVEADFAVSEGTWMSVDVSPDGRTVVFDLLGDIYSIPVSGGEARPLHGGSAIQRNPRFSPDGRDLLFISDGGGSSNLWISKADGSDARQLTGETVRLLSTPTWGPKGSFVAAALQFATEEANHSAELRLFDLGGGGGRLLVPTAKSGEPVLEPQLSRDGRYLYYTEKRTPPAEGRVYVDPSHSNLAIMRRDLYTGDTEQLIRGFGSAVAPQLSHDDRRVAFVRRVREKSVLFVYDVATGTETPVFDGLDRDSQADYSWLDGYYPQYGWFPDDRHVAIWGKGKLWKVDMDTGMAAEIPFRVHARHKLTVPPRFTHDLAPKTITVRAIRQLAYSPDDRSVAFNALGRLWRKDGPDAKPVRLTKARHFEFEPAFSRDGLRIAHIDWNDETGSRLVVTPAGGGKGKVVHRSAGVLRSPAFSPDGSRIVFQIDAGDRCLGGHEARVGIYWMSANGGEAHYVGPPGDAPMFSPDGARIYYSSRTYTGEAVVTALESLNLQGFDRRVHAKTLDADTSELRISPDLRWIAFRDRQQYYVTRHRETGEAVTLSMSGANANPVAKLSEIGGYGLVWSADSSRVHWAVGDRLLTATVAEHFRSGTAPQPQGLLVGLEAPVDAPVGDVAFTNGRIITMEGERVIERGTVLVRGNRIAAVGPASGIDVPAGAKIIDVSGKTVMPGLFDMHGHINNCYYTSSGLMPQRQAGRYADLAFGVTTNYDPYSLELPAYTQTEMTLTGDMVGPRSIESGLIAFGRIAKVDSGYVPIFSYEDARNFMARKRALGGTIVKSYRQPMRSQRQMLIKAGREAGVMVDVEGESDFYLDLSTYLDGNTNQQHNLPVATYYDDVVQLIARGRTPHTPTLIVLNGELLGDNFIYQHTRVWDDPKVRTFVQVVTSGYSPLGTPHYAPPHVRAMSTINVADELWDVGFRSVARSVKKLDDSGAIVNSGSHGHVTGLAMHWEMWLLSQGGMSNMRVLRTGTLNGAITLGLDGQLGSLEAGKLADLIVLDRNPLEDIRNSNSVRYTMVNGRLYDSGTMNEVGNYDRPRGKFFWEAGRTQNIDWETSWANQ
jgi:Tol biopolymer transport system component